MPTVASADRYPSLLELLDRGRILRTDDSFLHPGGDQVPPSSLVTDISTSFCGIRAAHEHISAGEVPLNSDHNNPFQAAAERSSIQTSPAAGYNDWVHSPEPGQPRFFISNPAEAVTKTPWWVVPLVWLPIIAALLIAACRSYGHSALSTAGFSAAGLILWQFIEYSIHRFIFHAIPSDPALIVIHFLFHGCHHKYPMDKERLVFPPLPAASIASLLYLLVRAATSQARSVPIFAGVLIGYLAYDMQHYAIHHGSHKLKMLRHARQNHLAHHYKSPAHGFGISSGLVDFLLQTCPPRPAQRRAMLK
ncbi:hypothetical protein WJX84_009766 [Apatococcus fuscideae]|uniref:Fatty acid hydroxylase domain-containing protein n=1 Tax=Apatococcus fuscideae TaxID=2026836 RepID=A0AAW1TDI4_9CHLO